jgi:diamine N-acetyltransferase
MLLTLADIATNPTLLKSLITLSSGETLILRPLMQSDIEALTAFLEQLSAETRRLSTFPSYDRETAQSVCDAIARYDKLRLVVDAGGRIVGLIEFSIDVPSDDLDRYEGYGVALDPMTARRFGPTLADDYQNRGLGSIVFPHVATIASRFGKPRIILWGGVLADNTRAIHYYTKCGFRVGGEFVNSDGITCLDMLLDI